MDSQQPAQDVAAIMAVYREIKWRDITRCRGKQHLERLLKKHPFQMLMRAARNYAIEMAGEEQQFCRGIGNFFGRDADWQGYAARDWEAPESQSPEDTAEQKAYDAIGRA